MKKSPPFSPIAVSEHPDKSELTDEQKLLVREKKNRLRIVTKRLERLADFHRAELHIEQRLEDGDTESSDHSELLYRANWNLENCDEAKLILNRLRFDIGDLEHVDNLLDETERRAENFEPPKARHYALSKSF